MKDKEEKRILDYAKVFELMVNSTAKYLQDSGIKTMILGISGGIDSSLTAAICRVVSDKTGIPLIGYSLPCSTNEECETTTADLVGKEFCDEYHVVNIQLLYEETEKVFNSTGTEGTNVSNGNIKARIRGSFLHNIASIKGGIVMDTDNETEFSLGFWTLRGGDEGEVNPIGELWKHEVYDLSDYLLKNVFKNSEALKASMALVPTDGNGVKAGGDLAQIAPGHTYEEVDEILIAWIGLHDVVKKIVIKSDFHHGIFEGLCEKYGHETVKGVIMRSINSEFKRRHLPFKIDLFNGQIVDGSGVLYDPAFFKDSIEECEKRKQGTS